MSHIQTGGTIAFDLLHTPAEQLLGRALGKPARIHGAELLTEAERRSRVWRCALVNTAGGEPHTVIIKQVSQHLYEPDNLESWHTLGFLRDWAGAAFLSEVCGAQRHSPQFYGGNRDLGFIALEDMGEHRSMVQPLLEGNAQEATTALIAFAERLGVCTPTRWVTKMTIGV